MNKQIIDIQRLKHRQQEQLEAKLGKVKQEISSVNNKISTLHNNKDINQQDKLIHIDSFYKNLRKAPKFGANVFYQLETDIAKFNTKHYDIENEIADKAEELRDLETQVEKLQKELKNIIVKLEKYQFIHDSLVS